jgi:N-acetylglucosaminyldiphosphoundecaprenol N-acetyl-beta-D-mannosaminyltransferase
MKENTYFNVKLEFDHDKVDQTIHDTISNKGKGYVCSVERNVMATANFDMHYQEIINHALINICDGAFVAKTIGWAREKKYNTYVGADLFIKYINKRVYSQYFLGNTPEVLSNLQNNLSNIDENINDMQFVTLPFKSAQDFDYQEIAININKYSPDIIWVSLGAPKQEEFMYNLLPYIDRGVMFGFGAIFNFYSGDKNFKRAPEIFLRLKFEWLYRMIQEPKKNFNRNWIFLKMVPKLIKQERLKINYEYCNNYSK